jgi:predicted transposase YdaD
VTDIIQYLCTVFDARKLNWFKTAIRTGLQIESETQMPTCFEALLEQGRKQGLKQGRKQGRKQGLLIGRIRTLQEVMGQPVAAEDALFLLSVEDLQTLADQLQAALASRPLHPGNG